MRMGIGRVAIVFVFALALANVAASTASAGASRVAVYPPAIRAMAGSNAGGAVYVNDHVCWPAYRMKECLRLPELEQRLISKELSHLPRFSFVSQRDDVVKPNSVVRHNGLLITLGRIHLRSRIRGHQRAIVFVSGYCANTCGTFLTYKLIHGPWRWRVVGTVGGVGVA